MAINFGTAENCSVENSSTSELQAVNCASQGAEKKQKVDEKQEHVCKQAKLDQKSSPGNSSDLLDASTISQDCMYLLQELFKCRRFIVKNIPGTCSKDELSEALCFLGSISSCNLSSETKTSERSQTQTASVLLAEFININDISARLKEVHLGKSRLHIEPCRKNDSIVFLMNLPLTLQDYSLTQIGAEYGVVVRGFIVRGWKSGQSKGYGFLEYENASQAAACIPKLTAKMNASKRQTERPCVVRLFEANVFNMKDIQSRVLLLDMVPVNYKGVLKLHRAFLKCGKVRFIKIIPDAARHFSRSVGIVEFDSFSAAESACEIYNNTPLPGTDYMMRILYGPPGLVGQHLSSQMESSTIAYSSAAGRGPHPMRPSFGASKTSPHPSFSSFSYGGMPVPPTFPASNQLVYETHKILEQKKLLEEEKKAIAEEKRKIEAQKVFLESQQMAASYAQQMYSQYHMAYNQMAQVGFDQRNYQYPYASPVTPTLNPAHSLASPQTPHPTHHIQHQLQHQPQPQHQHQHRNGLHSSSTPGSSKRGKSSFVQRSSKY